MNAEELQRRKIARVEAKVSIVDTLPNSFLVIDAVDYESETRVIAILDAQPTVSHRGGSGEMQ